jgi:hypothetical protein
MRLFRAVLAVKAEALVEPAVAAAVALGQEVAMAAA